MRLVKAISKLGLVGLSMLAGNAVASGSQVQLLVDQDSITEENEKYEWINFKAVASDNKTYEGSISCFTADRIYTGVATGSMNVLKTKTHVGVYTDFAYEECQDILENLRDGYEQVILSWDQDDFDASRTRGLLDFEREIN